MEMPDVIYARFIPERRNNSGTWSVFEKPHCKWGPTTRTVKVDHERQKYHHYRVVEALQKENNENCRLLGMSAEREIQLLQKVQQLENQVSCLMQNSESQTQTQMALIKKLAKTEWQPIETAPRDGTVFDVYTKYGRVTNCVACRQFGRIYSYDPESDNYDRKVNFATHWMPLPEPPTTEETK